ncbi:MAG TPA: PIG-L family deacetylase, partial [Luteitalea sp.]|nr:PIG-L family deacetylase [Luteitalea sp.]
PASAQILVLAPHPDDDILTSGGVIYRARQAGTAVWIMYMTNGDYAPTGTAWGYRREDEAAAAESMLGVADDNLVFLGYPDGSLQTLYSNFFNTPYVPTEHGYQGDRPILETLSTVAYARRGLGDTDYHHFAFGTAATNMGSNVVADLVHFLSNRRPTDIYTVGRCDRHSDHNTTYEFLLSALQQVRTSAPSYDPYIWQTIVWAGFNVAEMPNPPDADDWPLAPNPGTAFTEPVRVAACLSSNALVWAQRQSLVVPAPMLEANFDNNLKAQAIEQHVTQGGFNPITVRSRNDGHISAFVHRDEFFYRARASAAPAPRDPGSRPFPVDAGVDSGARDAGTDAGVDSGSDSGLDSGSDSGTQDGGATDSGNQDGGAIDSGAPADGGTSVVLDAGSEGSDAATQMADAAAASADAGTSGDGTSGAAPEAGSSDDDDLDQDIDDVLTGDAGQGAKGRKDSGCSITEAGSSAQSQLGIVLLGALSALFIRRRARHHRDARAANMRSS